MRKARRRGSSQEEERGIAPGVGREGDLGVGIEKGGGGGPVLVAETEEIIGGMEAETEGDLGGPDLVLGLVPTPLTRADETVIPVLRSLLNLWYQW